MLKRMFKIYHTSPNFSPREEISEVTDRPKIPLQENYSQADTLIQYLLSEPLDVTKRRSSSYDASKSLPDILVDSNVIIKKIEFLAHVEREFETS